MKVSELEPQEIFHYFEEILTIPRPSKHEEKIISYLFDFVTSHPHLSIEQDPVGNVLIRKPSSPGKEHSPSVCLQAHLDMVCEKNDRVTFDFHRDAIQTFVDGNLLRSKGTTLGADDGIGIAACLAVLGSTTLSHGPIECLFTVDEETGLTGAFGLARGWLNSNILLNLDSEDEGQVFIGCAGGKDTRIDIPIAQEPLPSEPHEWFSLQVRGLVGGHSGDDINKGRGNAIKLLVRVLFETWVTYHIKISEINGGNLRNAIAREASCILGLAPHHIPNFQKDCERFAETFRREFFETEPHLSIVFEKTNKTPGFCFSDSFSQNVIALLYACPHGVYSMSRKLANFVETSTNLASVKTLPGNILIGTSQRSSSDHGKIDVVNCVRSVFQLGQQNFKQITIEHSDGYPGWEPKQDSPIVRIIAERYNNLFGSSPEILIIHAGLECGLIGSKYPEMDMVSFGPTIKNCHSPDEYLDIPSVLKFWQLLVSILQTIGAKKD